MIFNKIAGLITDMVFPPICPVCDRIVRGRHTDICPECAHRLMYTDGPCCKKCGKPLEGDGKYCHDCSRYAHEYDAGCAALVYDEYMSKSIYRFKYGGKREFAAFYGRVMYERLGSKIKDWNVDGIVPVPIHKSRLKKRGYNQAALIAGELSKRLKIPVFYNLVTRCSATGAQKDLSAKARQNNLKKAFNVTQNVVKLNTILIVDDIYTTGATVDAMSVCLRGAGVKKIYFASLCIGRGN